MHIYLSGQHSARNHTTGKEWPSVVIHIYQQGNVFRVVRIPILELLLPSWPKKKKNLFQIDQLWICKYTHKTQEKNLVFFALWWSITVFPFLFCPRHYYNVGLHWGGIQLKICTSKCRRKEPHYWCKVFVGLPWEAFQQK